ncbi:UDP-N-acetylmuramoyl-tripeptide--D-alanyl-D-alanine ligase [Photobacterium galatheae]|uniref:UDP-N-acetylmuramoyl-tripeptide--D-alanyl-D-alanine ligase n=1 Tax=Photobacterium galatheae TaxID=1654360 RepID=A0A066RQX9_9GAMM|nr:UDP-N-acetylmuramoyl-tripeptide--D-alanyl-D-alanine ligase [Photobacterium galatheae]KDM92744.1 UDP-N-acetylmuramoyl-tripeptide--D-alanyl-D-alanine ligase [Photobacterium galatheae]MCM0149339.1 UDP-N-acetylmuramoyl-tripeptide--D-alanyl-D-alanine ligase [Photobacterium galatheae]
MIQVTLNELARALDARLMGQDVSIDKVSTDTRTIEPGTLFIALKGERFDAHDFAAQAQAQGAAALLVSRPLDVALPQLLVADTRQALGQLGAWLKAKMTREHGLKTVALTGSCGKTTVKEMVAAILGQCGNVLATAGNFNNDIGVPLTLLRLTPEHDFAVIELGANHEKEIAYTTALVQPEAALVNNLAASHLEGFGSMDGVARAKGEIFEGLVPGGTAVINLDSNALAIWQPVLADKQVVSFGGPDATPETAQKSVQKSVQNSVAGFSASGISINPQGCPCFTMRTPVGDVTLTLPVAGRHNVANTLAAAALALAMGATLAQIVAGLEQMTAVKGRALILKPRPGLRLIDDTYNASVASVKAAIDLLADFEGQRWLVFGDMAEMGLESERMHREIADYARQKELDRVMTFGKDSAIVSALNQGQHFSDKPALLDALTALVQQQIHQESLKDPQQQQEITVLAKGARSAQMEDVIAALQDL